MQGFLATHPRGLRARPTAAPNPRTGGAPAMLPFEARSLRHAGAAASAQTPVGRRCSRLVTRISGGDASAAAPGIVSGVWPASSRSAWATSPRTMRLM
jgi:hypothetical protein